LRSRTGSGTVPEAARRDDVIARDAAGICDRVGFPDLSGARILITGASGLIGSHMLACLGELKARGAAVDVYAQVYSDAPPHVADLAGRHGFTLLRADLSRFADYATLPEANLIVHAAGYAQPMRFMANPDRTLQINTSATMALLQRLAPGGHFQFLSSAEVYTGLRGGACGEAAVGTTTPAHPRAGYIEGKRAGEAACHAYRSQGVHATAIRLGDVYGPGTRPHDKRALNSFIERALTEGEIRMLDAGAAVRTYCYVSDAVELMWRILFTGAETVYNVGGRSVTTIAELAGTIGRLTGAAVFPGSLQAGVAGAPEALRLDLTRVEAEFGPREYVGLEAGLSATIAWQRPFYEGREPGAARG
jgi:nucleoside-diphosphate-sugar epimerase